jgi:GH25 family lysozyme M1 (1,4-beta-N-acetylmuramidase)
MAIVIDVSDVQSSVDWSRVAHSGIRGAYIKLSEGATWDAEESYVHARNAQAAGIPFGFYHYAHPERNEPEAEVQHVLHRLGRRKPAFKLALDLEHGRAQPQYGDWARRFSQALERRLGYLPLFYSYTAYIEAMRLGEPVGSGLWLAAFGRDDGREHPFVVPKPWRRAVMHQFSSRCRVGGCSSVVDLSHAASLGPLRAQ